MFHINKYILMSFGILFKQLKISKIIIPKCNKMLYLVNATIPYIQRLLEKFKKIVNRYD